MCRPKYTLITAKNMKKGSWQRPTQSTNGEIDIANHNAFKVNFMGRTVKGFTKKSSKGILRAFEDSNDDGFLNKGDQLIAKGRVEKKFRGEGSALQDFEAGSVRQKWETTYMDELPMPMLSPYLEFKNGDGELVGEVGIKIPPLMPRDDLAL